MAMFVVGLICCLVIVMPIGTTATSNTLKVLDLDQHGDLIDKLLNLDDPNDIEYNTKVVGLKQAHRDDNFDDLGLCVDRQYCINRDGAGLVEPRKKHPFCSRSKVFCYLADLSANYPRCGISKPNLINDRIASTQFNPVASFGEWPWIAQLVKKKSGYRERYECSAVLIDQQHLLTVAHCVDKIDESVTIVRLGEYNILRTKEPLPFRDYQIETIVMHPNFVSSNLHNDIALVRLIRPVRFAENIAPICLPSPIDDRRPTMLGQRFIVTGWGKNDEGEYTPVPKKVSLPFVGPVRCESLLRKTKLGRHFELHEGFICAGGEQGNDACFGDGGAPLMSHRNDGTYELTGLVSWGIGCGNRNVPGVYTDVAEYLDFIHDNIALPGDFNDDDEDNSEEDEDEDLFRKRPSTSTLST